MLLCWMDEERMGYFVSIFLDTAPTYLPTLPTQLAYLGWGDGCIALAFFFWGRWIELGSYSYSCLFYLEECAGIKIYAWNCIGLGMVELGTYSIRLS